MKKLSIILIAGLLLSACSTTKEASSSKADRNEKKLVEQVLVKNAVEAKRFIIKFDRLYVTFGGRVDLIPKANFLIVDRDRAIINTAYLGRQFDIRPIAAINVRGKASEYSLTDNTSKGSYEIKMKVNNPNSSTFDVYIKINKDGSCNATVSSLKIDNISYAGQLVPIQDNPNNNQQEGSSI